MFGGVTLQVGEEVGVEEGGKHQLVTHVSRLLSDSGEGWVAELGFLSFTPQRAGSTKGFSEVGKEKIIDKNAKLDQE